jgi:cytochrome c-type biogenesis protein CcmH
MRAVVSALCVALIVTAVMPAFAVDPTQMPTPELQERYLSLTHELRCMKCQNQSIADSPVGLASDLRREVHDMLVAGKSDEEIRQWMVSRYGDFILFRPQFVARNLWLWLAPVVLLLIGVVVALRIVRQRSRLVDSDLEPVDEAGPHSTLNEGAPRR